MFPTGSEPSICTQQAPKEFDSAEHIFLYLLLSGYPLVTVIK